jgi:hypothetical protein
MTFVKPYLGTFIYEGIIPSAVMNNINNDWPNALDKTGDNAGNGGGITGEIDILSGGSINMETFSNLNVNSGGNLNIISGGQVTVAAGGSALIAGYANVTGTLQTFGVGEIGITSGGHFDGYSGSTVNFHSGSVTTQAGAETVASGGSITVVTGGAIDITGGTITTSSTGTIETGVAGSLILGGGASDWPTFSAPRTRIIQYQPAALITTLDPPNYPPSNWTIQQEGAYLPCLVGVGTTVIQYIPFNPPNGSTINSLTMNIVVIHSHSAVPVMPKINVVRSTHDARTNPASLNAVAGQSFTPTPGTGAAWQAGQALQNWTFTANQLNVVDTSQYNYYVTLIDENGANAWDGNEYPSFTITYTLANMQPA